MDDALVARWREGDSTATTAVRNGIRTVAERMLGHSTLRGVTSAKARKVAEDEGQRREVTADIAREVMVRGGATAADVTAITIMVTARKLVELLRFERPFTGETHLPPQVAVSYALAPESLPKPSQDAAQKHTDECSGCAEDVRIVGAVVRANPNPDPIPRPVAPPPPAVPSVDDMSRDMAAIEAAATAERAERSERRRKEPPPPRETAARRAANAEREPADRRAWATLAVLGVASIIGLGFWHMHNRQVRYEKRMEIAQLVSRDVPILATFGAASRRAEYDGIAEALDRGDCQSAADQARTLRQQGGGGSEIYRVEAAAWVCVGDGAAAVEAIEAAPTFGDPWLAAQAHFLRGDVDLGLDSLDRAQSLGKYGALAEAMRRQVDDVWRR
jgi:hypothetical protein